MSSETTMSTGGAGGVPNPPNGTKTSPTARSTVIGIYGIPGCGKSHLLDQLSAHLSPDPGASAWLFFDGSQVIADQVLGGLPAFKSLSAKEQELAREDALKHIQRLSSEVGKAAVVAGHYSFWEEGSEPERVMTEADRRIYKQIIYLDTPAHSVHQYRQEDATRKRAAAPEDHLRKWAELEKEELRGICYRSGVLFSVLRPDSAESLVEATSSRVRDLALSSEEANREATRLVLGSMMRDIEADQKTRLKTAVVLDADRTLAPEDSGALFWASAAGRTPWADSNTLKAIFGSELGYSHLAFQQAALVYGDFGNDNIFGHLCDRVASKINLYPEIASFLQEAAQHDDVAIIVATCGLELVWDMVLRREGLHPRVRLLAAGGGTHSRVVTPKVKKEIVDWLRQTRGLTTWAFGDSPVDIPMLRAADHPVVVVGEGQARSTSMDAALYEAVEGGLAARQVLLPSTATPRFDNSSLPIAQLSDPSFRAAVFRGGSEMDLLHATDRAASKLIMTPTRDAGVSGPRLREAHHRMGLYLATELVAERLGLEEFLIPHVNGSQTAGFRLKDEAKTLIVALMRAGEPMASGVSTAFPTATFLHAKDPCDLPAPRIKEASAILLVDAVVNEGTTAATFVQHIRGVDPEAQVVIVAGVVQGRCVGRDGGNQFARLMREDDRLTLVALRISENKYTGKGTVDTGNRLFNTTHIA